MRFITNKTAPIRRMNVDQYEVVNTISIVMTTNYKDGVPVSSEDTRYYPMFSRWQSQAALALFNQEHPQYYAELAAILDDPDNHGALRKWLLEVKLSKSFNPNKRAPVSSSREELVYLNQTEEDDAFDEALSAESGNRAFCSELLAANLVDEMMMQHGGTSAPYGRQKKTFLSGKGFTFLGAAKDAENKTVKWWSRVPDKFRKADGTLNTAAIRKWLDG